MKLAIWKTGHPIADTVADALVEGFNAPCYDTRFDKVSDFSADAHIAYGILRGTDAIYSKRRNWFNFDRGYFNPGHYDGYYRISYQGTQAKWHDGIPRKKFCGEIEPWREWDELKPVLICPPTDHVCNFFDIDEWRASIPLTYVYGKKTPSSDYVIRHKGDASPIDWDNIRAVITFNSSVGWQALQRGIPVLSDPIHSIVGSHYSAYGINDMQSLTDNLWKMPDTRLELFEAMTAHQFTLSEIREGKAWDLIKHYLSTSDTIAEKR